MRFNLSILVTFIFSILSLTVFSQTNYFSINDNLGSGGDWSNVAYWSDVSGGSPLGSSPGSSPGNSTVIKVETYINMDYDVTEFGSLEIAAGDSLKTEVNSLGIKAGSTLIVAGVLKVWDLTFFNGSVIDVKSGGEIIVLNDFTNKNNSDDVVIDGTVTVTGTFYNGNGGVITGNGSITASSFTGTGTTFGYTNNTIPSNSTVTSAPLPVELLFFTGKLNGTQVGLSWETASEINNDYFTVERSVDAENFEPIGRVDGKGTYNGKSDYSLMDFNPLQGISYYRLKQTDFDGKFTYSDIISINYIFSSPFVQPAMKIYPNPAINGSDVRLEVSGLPASKEVLVVVNNILGQQMYSKVILTNSSGTILEALDPYNQLPPGTYVIVAASDDKLLSKRLIISR